MVIWVGAAAAVVASVLFAPILGVGWCADGIDHSECGSYAVSVVGIETNVWIWLVALIPIVVATAIAARAARRRG